jgi:hypothetical protein
MRDLFETAPDDGLVTLEVGPWAEEKHRLLAHDATLFARAMKGKWDDLVYIDLFAGPGRCRVRGSERIYRSSPTIVLSLPDAFNSYVFCDADPRNADALRLRATEEASDRTFTVLSGDANAMVTDVSEYTYRIRDLLTVPAAVRFLSIEPLLGPLGRYRLAGIDWVIVGGESGPRSRDINESWVRSIRDRCVSQEIPFFFKQWGGTRKKNTGRLLDGRTWDEMPEPKERVQAGTSLIPLRVVDAI